MAGRIVDNVNKFVVAQAASLTQSVALNFAIWPIAEKVHDEAFLFPTYAEGVEFLKQTQAARAEFLTEAFQTLADGGTVPVTGGQDSIDEIGADKPGLSTPIFDLQGRRVVNPVRGLYVKGGKLVVVD